MNFSNRFQPFAIETEGLLSKKKDKCFAIDTL